MDIIPAIARITVFVIPNWFETVVKLMFTIKKIDLKKNLKNEGTLNYPSFSLNQFI